MLEKWCCAEDRKAEQCLLSYVLLTKDLPLGFMAEYFTGSRYKLACEIIHQWKYSDINKHIMAEDLRETANLCLREEADGTEELRWHLRSLWMLREAGRAIVGVLSKECSPKEAIQSIQDQCANILSDSQKCEYVHRKAVSDLLQAVENAQCDFRGIPCGMEYFDLAIGSFEKKKVYAIGALKKTGKTQFAVWLAIQLAKRDQRILINTLEMSAVSINSLALAHFSKIDSKRLGSKLNAKELEKMSGALDLMLSLDWKIYTCPTASELRSRIAYEKAHDGVDFVFVDYIQRMTSEKYPRDRAREVEDCALRLADIARDMDVGVFVLSQLQGFVEKLPPEVVPDMGHYKESGGIAESSDCIITLHNPFRKEIQTGEYTPKTFRARVEQRAGLSGGVYDIVADLRTCTFGELDQNHEDSYQSTNRPYADI